MTDRQKTHEIESPVISFHSQVKPSVPVSLHHLIATKSKNGYTENPSNPRIDLPTTQ